ncbi:TPA: hypothetical protein DDZ86_00105 [Candidatus Dependentiae bacterium]|nr:MAG: hypothetical protein UW09_C0002G0098 [candidate division TM6 bacterium GW2011_GWF2_43_87]HBL98030.1 hypothetical protein [Candidatus Dependentiae bacterium]
MKKYRPLIATALLTLSQSPLYGMNQDEKNFIESFNLNLEENSSGPTDFFALLNPPSNSGLDSNSSLEQAIDLENKNLILPSFNVDDSANKETQNKGLQKIAPPSKKRPREDKKEPLKNQSTQKKTHLNQPIFLFIPQQKQLIPKPQSSAYPAKIPLQKLNINQNSQALQKTPNSRYKRGKNGNKKSASYWNLERWRSKTTTFKQHLITTLLEEAGRSTNKLAEIEKMLKKNISRPKELLIWLSTPLEDQKASIIQNAINQANLTHLRSILNLLVAKINTLIISTQLTRYNELENYLEECILSSTTPECSNLITNIKNIIKNALQSNQGNSIFSDLQKILNPQATSLPALTQTITTTTKTNNPINTNISDKDLDDLLETMQTIEPPMQNNTRAPLIIPTQNSSIINQNNTAQQCNTPQPPLKPLTETPSTIKTVLPTKYKKPGNLISCIFTAKKNNPSIMQEIINKNNNQQLALTLQSVCKEINRLTPYHQTNNYKLLARKLTTCMPQNTTTPCTTLISNAIKVIEKTKPTNIAEHLEKKILIPQIQQTQQTSFNSSNVKQLPNNSKQH